MIRREPHVFVVQVPSRFDKNLRKYVPTTLLDGIEDYGHPIIMLRPGNVFEHKLPQMLQTLENALFDFSPDDFVLASGDPVCISAAVLIAARKSGGLVKILKHSRLTLDYQVFPLSFGGFGNAA